ncbi:hypothetical protein JCM33374_g6653 [Metschnikowia sp. JCM 33374]|nr:hypothetical protein JCM33374_g6653 [Metschnikowia sp. JCM 33374]
MPRTQNKFLTNQICSHCCCPAPAAAAPTPPSASWAHPSPNPTRPRFVWDKWPSTAAGVAVGSTIGHTLGAGITSMFGGSSAPAEQPQQQVAATQQQNHQEQARTCDTDARSFTRCLEENSGNMQICDYYLQQLRACQEASRSY